MSRSTSKKTVPGAQEPAAIFVEFFTSFVTPMFFPPRADTNAPDLTYQETRSLFWIGRHNPCLMSEFARGMDIPLSTATHTIDRLVEKKLISRQRSEEDRRAVEISLTGLGLARQQAFQERLLTGSKELLASLSPSEVAALISTLRKMSLKDNVR